MFCAGKNDGLDACVLVMDAYHKGDRGGADMNEWLLMG